MIQKLKAFVLAAAVTATMIMSGCAFAPTQPANTATAEATEAAEEAGAAEGADAAEAASPDGQGSEEQTPETAEEQTAESADSQPEEEAPAQNTIHDNGDTLVIALQQELRSLDPAKASDQASKTVGSQIWDSLMAYDENGALVPGLAVSCETQDGLTYVYTIRDDVVFSDGEPMTMEDVLFSLSRHMEPELHSVFRDVYTNVMEIKQTGDWELTVKLRNQDPSWQYAMAGGAGAVIEKMYCEEQEDFGGPEAGVIGTGPYRFERWAKGEEIVLVRNYLYRENHDENGIQTICFRIFRDEVSLLSQLRTGDADLCISPPAETREDAAGIAHLRTEAIPSQTCLILVMNCKNKYFADQQVRTAVAHMIDRDELFEGIISQDGEPGIHMLPFSAAQYGAESESWEAFAETVYKPETDSDAARECMENSSASEGFSCRLFYKGTPMRSVCAEYIDQVLGDIGIDVETEEMTGPDMNNYQNGINRDYDLLLISWEAQYPDPAASIYPLLISSQIGEGGTNCACYNSPDVDKLLEAQRKSYDLEERTQLMQEALEIAAEDSPMTTICCVDQFVIVNERIGFTFTPMFSWDFPIENVRIGNTAAPAQ